MHAVVRLVEMLGDATVATLEIATANWNSGQGHSEQGNSVEKDQVFDVQSKVGSRSRLQPGDVVGVRMDAEQVHVFDSVTGQNWVRRPVAA